MSIISFLKITEKEYETIRFEIWVNWCQNKSITVQELQGLLINVPMNNWFNTELMKIEQRFMKETAMYRHKIDSQSLVESYRDYMTRLNSLFITALHQPKRISNLNQLHNEINFDNQCN